jgi:beta-glucosidase/6-phospho-beta-glucosidase/beta-galactosidase
LKDVIIDAAAPRSTTRRSQSTARSTIRCACFILREHIAAVARAIDAGVDVRGYFVGSLLDNLEWSHGFTKRFGIIHVNFATQERTLKKSAAFYRELIRKQRA